jgi:hypothetical protein
MRPPGGSVLPENGRATWDSRRYLFTADERPI